MTDHELDKLLADVAGYTEENGTLFIDGEYIALISREHGHLRWTPLTDHNQIYLVETGLSKKGFTIMLKFWAISGEYTVELDDHAGHIYCAGHKDKLRTIGLAVSQMKGGM